MNEEELKIAKEKIAQSKQNNSELNKGSNRSDIKEPGSLVSGCLSILIILAAIVAAIRLAPWAYGYIKLAALWLYNFGLAMHPVDRLAVLVLCLYILGRPKYRRLKATTENIRRK